MIEIFGGELTFVLSGGGLLLEFCDSSSKRTKRLLVLNLNCSLAVLRFTFYSQFYTVNWRIGFLLVLTSSVTSGEPRRFLVSISVYPK